MIEDSSAVVSTLVLTELLVCDPPPPNQPYASCQTNGLHVTTTTGLIPGIGDALGAAFALELIRKAAKADLPYNVLGMMMFNVMFDFAVCYNITFLSVVLQHHLLTLYVIYVDWLGANSRRCFGFHVQS